MITNFNIGDIFVSDKKHFCPVLVLSAYDMMNDKKYYFGGFNGLMPFSNFGSGATKQEILNDLNKDNYHYCGNINEKVNKSLEFYKAKHFKKIDKVG